MVSGEDFPDKTNPLTQQCSIKSRFSNTNLYPIGSMYAIYRNIYHQYTPNVSIYTSTMDPLRVLIFQARLPGSIPYAPCMEYQHLPHK